MKKIITLALAAIIFAACGMQKPLSEAQYAQSVRKSMPFAVSEFKQVKPDVYSFKCDKFVTMYPDYEVDDQGALMIWRTTFVPTHTEQPAQYIWRNLVIDKRYGRVLCVDRLLKGGKTFGYVYVLQSDTKLVVSGYHWDVTDPRHMLNVAPILTEESKLSLELLKTLAQ